ncbi:hypothetical protein GCM10010185_57560 [Saccharothrix coeruleofusca]|uniref:Syndecan 1 n=1 Tax=Saccharothrix coeruleofusca TaxID=33919 RepID=A0A918AS63_9PSEU|nr:hypothetical protein GCM10010185_57560 [Saccharothrix coeruleofusca]
MPEPTGRPEPTGGRRAALPVVALDRPPFPRGNPDQPTASVAPLLLNRPLMTSTPSTAPAPVHRAAKPVVRPRWSGARQQDSPVQRSVKPAPPRPLGGGAGQARPVVPPHPSTTPVPPGAHRSPPAPRTPTGAVPVTWKTVQMDRTPARPPSTLRVANPTTAQHREAPAEPRENTTARPGAAKSTTDTSNDGTASLDVDALARRLHESISRQLRDELRHGRERFGRPHDRRSTR